MRYFSQPAILILFIDQGNGNYTLDALNFSEMLMDKGMPDLVRRYIRDEIMKKETSYVEIISSGLYAIGEALNPIYKERLITKHLSLFDGNQYKRRYSYFTPFNYYEFEPYHTETVKMLPDLIRFVDNDLYFDWSNIEYTNTEVLDVSKKYKDTVPWYDQYLNKEITTPVLREIIDHPRTAEENKILITNLFKKDLHAIANNPFHYLEENIDTHHENSILDLAFDTRVIMQYRLDYYGCRLRVHKRTLSKQWDYIPDVINRAVYPSWGEKGPTWCNQYGAALSNEIFQKTVIPSKTANDLHEHMIAHSSDFVLLNKEMDPYFFIVSGFIVYFVWVNEDGPGHFETGIPSGIESMDRNHKIITLQEDVTYTVGAGASLGAKTYISRDLKYDRFVYLGYLKK